MITFCYDLPNMPLPSNPQLYQIIAFVDNVEKVSKSGMPMKTTIKKFVATLDEICREMLDLRRQIHPVHGLCNEETSK